MNHDALTDLPPCAAAIVHSGIESAKTMIDYGDYEDAFKLDEVTVRDIKIIAVKVKNCADKEKEKVDALIASISTNIRLRYPGVLAEGENVYIYNRSSDGKLSVLCPLCREEKIINDGRDINYTTHLNVSHPIPGQVRRPKNKKKRNNIDGFSSSFFILVFLVILTLSCLYPHFFYQPTNFPIIIN